LRLVRKTFKERNTIYRKVKIDRWIVVISSISESKFLQEATSVYCLISFTI